MAYTKGTLEHGGDILLPKTTLDQLYTSDASTAIVGGDANTIKQDYLPVSGEELGIVKVNTEWNTYGVHLVINAGTVSVAGKYASASQFGAVKVNTSASNGVSLAISNGTISASAQYASTNSFGVVMVPGGSTNGVSLNISDGMLYASGVLAQSNVFGVVKAGNYVTISDGVLSVNLADTDAGGGTAGAVYVNPTNGGGGISLSIINGKLDVHAAAANKNQFGTVKIGDNIDVTYDDGVHEDGIISVPLAGTATAGVVLLASSIGTSTTNVVTEVLVKNAVDNLQGQITSITGTTVTDLQNQISAITGTTVANLQGQINDITGTTVSNLQGQISAITGTTVTDLQGQITDITGTTVADLQNQINGKQNTLSAGAGIEINGSNVISTTSVMKIMTTAQRTAITPEAGQVIYDSTLGQLFLGDGFTPGGTLIGAGGGGGSVTPGYRLSDDGTYLNFNPVQVIQTVTGTSVTLEPDTAYKASAVNGTLTLNANPPASGSWGLEGHLELFTAGTGYIVTGTNVVLANALEPDAVNNCTVRFHDGIAIIAVEDHVAGYIVVSATGTSAGSLYYALGTASQEYIAVDASLNGHTLDLGGAVTNGEKHIVGNGYAETVLTGGVSCTSKTTVSNLSLLNVAVNGGTMTIGDGFIPEGSTVSVPAGRLKIEKVTGNGGIIDFCNRAPFTEIVGAGTTVSISGVTMTHGSGGYLTSSGTVLNMSNCVISGNYNIITYNNTIVDIRGSANLTSCIISGNTNASDLKPRGPSAKITLDGCKIQYARVQSSGTYILKGSNYLRGGISGIGGSTGCFLTVSSGAIVDLTGSYDGINAALGATIYPDVTIIGSAGSETQTRSFSGAALISGTSISLSGKIVGATVTVMSGTCGVSFIKSGEEIVSSALVDSTQSPYVLETEQGAGAVLVGTTNVE